jgi:hypothetical protein
LFGVQFGNSDFRKFIKDISFQTDGRNDEAKTLIPDVEETVRTLTVRGGLLLETKKPFFGCAIQDKKSIEYEEEVIIRWLIKKNMIGLLKINDINMTALHFCIDTNKDLRIIDIQIANGKVSIYDATEMKLEKAIFISNLISSIYLNYNQEKQNGKLMMGKQLHSLIANDNTMDKILKILPIRISDITSKMSELI